MVSMENNKIAYMNYPCSSGTKTLHFSFLIKSLVYPTHHSAADSNKCCLSEKKCKKMLRSIIKYLILDIFSFWSKQLIFTMPFIFILSKIFVAVLNIFCFVLLIYWFCRCLVQVNDSIYLCVASKI